MKKNYAILSAILAAALYALNAPASKLSLVIFRDWPGWLFFAALAVMIVATVLVTKDQAGGEANE